MKTPKDGQIVKVKKTGQIVIVIEHCPNIHSNAYRVSGEAYYLAKDLELLK